MKIGHFEDIEAWQLVRELTHKVYRLTKKQGFEKDYGLKRQIEEAAGSAMHNIAEGFDSETNAEFIRFLRYAKRSWRYKVNYISCLTRSIFPRQNSKMSMNRPDALV
jgi:four helix bundle protein